MSFLISVGHRQSVDNEWSSPMLYGVLRTKGTEADLIEVNLRP